MPPRPRSRASTISNGSAVNSMKTTSTSNSNKAAPVVKVVSRAPSSVMALWSLPSYDAKYDSDGIEVSPDWPIVRRTLGLVFISVQFDLLLGMLILFNMVLIIVETDANALGSNQEVPTWVEVANIFLVVIYNMELVLRLYTFRWKFFEHGMNNLDLFVVVADDIGSLVPGRSDAAISMFRILRLMRLARGVRILTYFPELAMMVKGMACAMRSIVWGTMLIGIAVTIWAVLAVQFIHPLNVEIAETGYYDDCDRCAKAFQSVFASLLTFTQQIVTGDSWGLVTIPLIEKNSYTLVFFVGVLGTVGMGVMNLILAVIVDRAVEARHENDAEMVKVKESRKRDAANELHRVCESMDANRDGVLTVEELIHGYLNNPDFANYMKILDVSVEDIPVVFEILDDDKSGTISYSEFCEHLYKLKSDDTQKLMVFTKFYVEEILVRTTKQMEWIKNDVMGALHKTLRRLDYLKSDKFDEWSDNDGEDGTGSQPLTLKTLRGAYRQKIITQDWQKSPSSGSTHTLQMATKEIVQMLSFGGKRSGSNSFRSDSSLGKSEAKSEAKSDASGEMTPQFGSGASPKKNADNSEPHERVQQRGEMTQPSYPLMVAMDGKSPRAVASNARPVPITIELPDGEEAEASVRSAQNPRQPVANHQKAGNTLLRDLRHQQDQARRLSVDSQTSMSSVWAGADWAQETPDDPSVELKFRSLEEEVHQVNGRHPAAAHATISDDSDRRQYHDAGFARTYSALSRC